MNWSSSTLRAAAEIQAQIEQLNQVLTELLQPDGVPVTASKGRGNLVTAPRASELEGEAGGPLGPTMTGTKVEGAPLNLTELLDGLLFWGSEVTSAKPKQTRRAPIYHIQGLKRIDSGRLLTGLEPL